MLEETGRGGRREAGRDFEDRSRESNRIDAAIGNGCAHDGAAEGDFETGRNGEAVVDGARFTPAGGCIEIERARVAGGVDEAELDSRQECVRHVVRVAERRDRGKAAVTPAPNVKTNEMRKDLQPSERAKDNCEQEGNGGQSTHDAPSLRFSFSVIRPRSDREKPGVSEDDN